MTPLPHGNFSAGRLVIFGCGYVGSALGAFARDRGIRVTAVTRNAANEPGLRDAGFDVVIADIAGDSWHEEVEARPEFALNCVSSGGGGADTARHSYVGGMDSIARWTRKHGPVGTLVYTSSTSVYQQDGGVIVDESAETGGSGRAGLLVEAERRFAEAGGLCDRLFLLRLAGIYGPGRHRFLDQLRAGALPDGGAGHLNLVHRDDIVSAIWACFAAAPHIRNQVFNVADDGRATRGEIVEWLRAAAGRSDSVPEGGGLPSGRRAASPDRIVANARIKALLGWQPRFPTFREGYRAILAAAGSSAIL